MTFGRSGTLPESKDVALWFIAKRPGITEAQLAEAMFGRPEQPRVHQEVTLLENQGLVRRDRSCKPMRLYAEVSK
jgi:hypothetical protein